MYLGVFCVQLRGPEASVTDAGGEENQLKGDARGSWATTAQRMPFILQSFTRGEGGKEGESVNRISLTKSIRAGAVFEACIGTLHQE